MSDTTITPDQTPEEAAETPNDRRALLRKLAIGGAGAAAGAVLLNHGTAKADDGDELIIGQTNTATSATILARDPAAAVTAGPSSFSVAGAAPGNDAPFPAQVGGYGNDEVANGVHGSTTNPAGFGVVAANLAPAAAATAAAPKALAIASSGAHMLFVAGAQAGPAPGTHVAGELYVDAAGTLWFTVPGPGDTIRFVKLAGTPTAGQFHVINPQRVYDSRQPNYPAALRGAMTPNTNRVVSVADGRSANGTVTLPNAIPAGATAVQINLTADRTTGPNFLQVTAGNVTTTETSVLNWNGVNVQIANSITVPVSPNREIRIYNGNQTGSTEVIVDVFGYYL
jgi:hypothetical protein